MQVFSVKSYSFPRHVPDGTLMTIEQARTVKIGDTVHYGKQPFTCLEIRNSETMARTYADDWNGIQFRLDVMTADNATLRDRFAAENSGRSVYDSPWFPYELCGRPRKATAAAAA